MADKAVGVADGSQVTLVADMTSLGHQTLVIPNANAILLSDPSTHDGPNILGIVDINGDGRSEVFEQIDHGASTAFFTIVTIDGGRLTQVTLDGAPVGFPLGGSVGHSSRIGCGDGQLTMSGVSTSDQFRSFDGERDVYGLTAARLIRIDHTTQKFHADDGGSPIGLEAAGYDLHCAPLD